MSFSENYPNLFQKIKALEDEVAYLKEKNAFLERVIHEVPANIYISDLEQGVVWCNRTNEESLGYKLEEILEMGGLKYLYQIVHPDDHAVPNDSIEHYKNFTGAEFGGLFRAKHKHSQEYKWFIGWAKAFRKNDEDQVKELLCVDVDMSPQMNTEEQLVLALRDNLKQKNKLLLDNLRKRELEILRMICQGLNTKAISEQLCLSVHTVTTHRKNIQRKLGTSNVADTVALAKEVGIV